jgi:hypothetical protein
LLNEEAERLEKQKERWNKERSLSKEEEALSWTPTIESLEKVYKDFYSYKDFPKGKFNPNPVWLCEENYTDEDKATCKKEVIMEKLGNLSPFDNDQRLQAEILDKLKRKDMDLKSRIRNTNPIELVKTIETETNALFGKMANKIAQQEKIIVYSLLFKQKLDELLTDAPLNTTKDFLNKRKIEISNLTEQDIHRIIMVLALSAFTSLDKNTETEKLLTLIRKMRLIK